MYVDFIAESYFGNLILVHLLVNKLLYLNRDESYLSDIDFKGTFRILYKYYWF